MSYGRTTLGPRGRGMGAITTDQTISIVNSETGRPLASGAIPSWLLWGSVAVAGYALYTHQTKRAPGPARARARKARR